MPRKKSAPTVRAGSKTNGKANGKPDSNGKANIDTNSAALRREGQQLFFERDDRRWRIRGLDENHSPRRLEVNLLVSRDELVHTDTLDLYCDRPRQSFIRAAAAELFLEEAVVKRDLGQLLLALEGLQQERIEVATASVELGEADRRAALELLRDPELLVRIERDYDTCGLVGEETNKLVSYLACASRLLPQPLAVLIQSGSAAGKTSLMDATLAFMPDETQVRYSALTGQSLYYMRDLSHKILAVAEEAGVGQAAYALKLLQSDGSLRIAAAGKNRGTARQTTETYEVEGPVAMLLTTTAAQPDEELANRCLLLEVNESPAQTAAIQVRQREAYTLEGKRRREERDRLRELHQNAQRLLEPLPVVFPWAEELGFRCDQTRMRRDHAGYLSLIAASALLFQYQRPRREDDNGRPYLLAAADDVRLANRLFSQLMGRSLESQLPQTRQLLSLLADYVKQRAGREKTSPGQLRFTQRQLRESLGWGDFQLRRHLQRLVELEYVLVHRARRGNQRFYQLLVDVQEQDSRPLLLDLIDADQLEMMDAYPSAV